MTSPESKTAKILIAALTAVVICCLATATNPSLAYASGKPPKLLWKFSTHDDVLGLAVGHDGVVYALTVIGKKIYAISPNGKLLQQLPIRGMARSLVVASNGIIYVASLEGHTYAFAPDGALKWRRRFSAMVAANDGTIIGESGVALGLCAFAPNGDLQWQFTKGFMFEGLAIGADGIIYGLAEEGSYGVYAFYPSGAVKWKLLRPLSFYSWLGVGERGNVYAVSGNEIYALSPNGTLRWKSKVKVPLGVVNERRVAERDGIIYLACEARYPTGGVFAPPGPQYRLLAINSHTGSLVWSFDKVRGRINALVVGHDGDIYVGSYDGHVYALDPETGALKWRYWTGGRRWGSMPVSALALGEDGTIYVGTAIYVEAIRSP